MAFATPSGPNEVLRTSMLDQEKQNVENPPSTTQQTESNDPNYPFNWSIPKKWSVTLIACYVTFIVGINATAITAAASETNTRFGISDHSFPNSVWPITAWNTGAAIAPMLVLPIMEEHGMRLAYLIIYVVFFIFVIPQATARNFTTLIVCRFLAGSCGGVLQGVMDGIIADMWNGPVQRSLPVSCYVVSLLTGLMIYGASAPIVLLIFRETRLPVILSKTLKRQEEKPPQSHGEYRLYQRDALHSFQVFLRENIIRPSFLLCTEAVVFSFTLLSGLSYGLVFISTQSVTQVYSTNYDFAESQTGFVQAALVVGEIVGFLSCCFIQDPHFARTLSASTLIPNPLLPESRLHLAIPGSLVGLMGGLFWYGWTSYPTLSWWLPTAGLFLIGYGSMVVMQAIMMYITDAYAKYAASASAAICFGENIFAAFLPLASQSMYTRLGFHWASSLLGLVAFALSFAPVALVWKGEETKTCLRAFSARKPAEMSLRQRERVSNPGLQRSW
ncbi:uncharacterized protein KY384_009234 [Bacidia gigantensis]|uniref:uncharacterized protein n=1 Tax=Bacidia gigantensis TaxID=2732470 RepID=UPI001D0364A8|nr:uncharacterized protein KY384_009234 [Bacidia gigantensis]KAG8525590.1 hypothetical protein KY384_009234 [Bacidia gigantensis]